MAKSSIVVNLGRETMSILEKRAKRELLSVSELASDILRKSAISSGKTSASDKIYDKYLSFFSRKTRKK